VSSMIRIRSRQVAPTPTHRAVDRLTAALLDVQRLRRSCAADGCNGLDDELHRLELKLRDAAITFRGDPAGGTGGDGTSFQA
jgi:hypothetical protein